MLDIILPELIMEKNQSSTKKKPTEGRRNGKDTLPFDVELATKAIARSDRSMAKLIKNVGPCKLKVQTMQSCFETLMESIVYQQLTGKAAATILGRVKALYGDNFPSPEQVIASEDQTLCAAGLSGAKTAAIKDLAEKASIGFLPDIEQLHNLSDEQIVEILSSVRGIGEWTVQMLLIFRLGRPDVMPSNDYGVRKGFARTYEFEELPSPKQLLLHAEKWRPYRTIASWYLWRSLEL